MTALGQLYGIARRVVALRIRAEQWWISGTWRTEGFLLQNTISASVGDYLCFLDSDDYISTVQIELCGCSGARSDRIWWAITRGDRRQTLGSSLSSAPGLWNALVPYGKGKWYVMAWRQAGGRPSFCSINSTSRALYEDDLWSFKLACMSQSMYIIVGPPVFHAAKIPSAWRHLCVIWNVVCQGAWLYLRHPVFGVCRITGSIYILWGLKAKYFDVFCISESYILSLSELLVFRNKVASLLEWQGCTSNATDAEHHYVLPAYTNMFQAFVVSLLLFKVLSPNEGNVSYKIDEYE